MVHLEVVEVSQSLFHQVNLSDVSNRRAEWCVCCTVAIPFSSGQSFRPLFRKSYINSLSSWSQSLFHQVNLSDVSNRRAEWCVCCTVAIPFSSGQSFRLKMRIKNVLASASSESQSLFHQVNVSDDFAYYYDGNWTGTASQSLFHQVNLSDGIQKLEWARASR